MFDRYFNSKVYYNTRLLERLRLVTAHVSVFMDTYDEDILNRFLLDAATVLRILNNNVYDISGDEYLLLKALTQKDPAVAFVEHRQYYHIDWGRPVSRGMMKHIDKNFVIV